MPKFNRAASNPLFFMIFKVVYLLLCLLVLFEFFMVSTFFFVSFEINIIKKQSNFFQQRAKGVID